MKAGRYWVGDLCYIMPDEEWREVCRFMGNGSEPIEGVFRLGEHEGAIFGTAHGDGVYRDQFKNSYGVDSGTIGIFPAGVFGGQFVLGGHFIDFPEDFEVSSDRGNMKFGHIKIKTRGRSQ